MLIEQAKQWIKEIHDGQFRKDGVTPFVQHPLLVADYVKEFYGQHEAYTDDVYIAALAHDTVEDQPDRTNYEDISNRFGSKVSEYVRWLTRKPGQQKSDYYYELGNNAPAQAIWIKFCDRLANLVDSSKLILDDENHKFVSYYIQDTMKMMDALGTVYEDNMVISVIIHMMKENICNLYYPTYIIGETK